LAQAAFRLRLAGTGSPLWRHADRGGTGHHRPQAGSVRAGQSRTRTDDALADRPVPLRQLPVPVRAIRRPIAEPLRTGDLLLLHDHAAGRSGGTSLEARTVI